MKKPIAFFLFLFSATFITAQNYTLNGVVQGANNEKLLSASVVLLSQVDSTLVSFGLTNDNGEFKIKDTKEGQYILQVTFLGYEQYNKTIDVNADFNSEIGLIQLLQTNSELAQVEIKGEHVPIMVNKDTLVYNADAFQTQPNEVVEDLLKKLPGVEVDDDGTITAQGEEVQKVLVDGKKFFGDDPKIATRNLPADAVKKVEVYDKKSDMAEFSGMDDGEREKTINLELKADRRKGQFGSIEGGYGTEDRYKGRLSLNRFSQSTQLSAIGNFNNINEQGFSSSDYISFVQGMGGNWRGANDLGLSISDGLSNGFVTSNAGGLNVNHDISSKVDMSVSYFLNDISNDIVSSLSRETFGELGSYFDNSTAQSLNQSTNHRINTEVNIEIDSSQDLKLTASYVNNNGDIFSDANSERLDQDNLIQNSSQQEYTTTGSSDDIAVSALYRKKFGTIKKRILSIRGQINDNGESSEGELESENDFFKDQISILTQSILQDQLHNDDQTRYNIRASFVEPLNNGTFLELKYQRQNFSNELRREVSDRLNGVSTFNDDLSNHYQRDYHFDRGALAWHLNTEKSSLTLEGAVQNSVLNGNIISEDVLIKNSIIRFLPRLSWRTELGSSQSIRLRYNTSVNEPSIVQLQPYPDVSDPINVYIGNPDLTPEYRHSVRLNYTNYDQFSFRSLFAFLNMNYTKNKIANQSIIDEDFRQVTRPVNVDYDLNLSGNVNYSSPVSVLKSRVTVGTRVSFQESKVFLNSTENTRNRYIGNINAKIENRNKTTIDWEFGGRWSYNITKYDLNPRDQNFFNQSAYADLTYNIKKSFSVSTSINVNFYSEEQFGEAVTVPIWKASLSKYLLKDQKGEIRLSAFDILNQNIGISRVNGLNFVENREITSLARYFMVSFIYSIRSAGSGGDSGGRRTFIRR